MGRFFREARGQIQLGARHHPGAGIVTEGFLRSVLNHQTFRDPEPAKKSGRLIRHVQLIGLTGHTPESGLRGDVEVSGHGVKCHRAPIPIGSGGWL